MRWVKVMAESSNSCDLILCDSFSHLMNKDHESMLKPAPWDIIYLIGGC